VNGAGIEAVNKAVAKAASAASASAAGKAVAGHVYSGQQNFNIYDIGTTVVAELIIRYSQRQKLVRLRARCGGLFCLWKSDAHWDILSREACMRG
jgi:hypothetical protein